MQAHFVAGEQRPSEQMHGSASTKLQTDGYEIREYKINKRKNSTDQWCATEREMGAPNSMPTRLLAARSPPLATHKRLLVSWGRRAPADGTKEAPNQLGWGEGSRQHVKLRYKVEVYTLLFLIS